MIKCVVIAVAACFCALQLKKNNGEYAAAVVIAAGTGIFLFAVSSLSEIAGDISDIFKSTNVDFSYLKIMLKCLGICLLAQFASDTCEDSGYSALGNQILLAGKVLILALSMPMLREILKIITELINQ